MRLPGIKQAPREVCAELPDNGEHVTDDQAYKRDNVRATELCDGLDYCV